MVPGSHGPTKLQQNCQLPSSTEYKQGCDFGRIGEPNGEWLRSELWFYQYLKRLIKQKTDFVIPGGPKRRKGHG